MKSLQLQSKTLLAAAVAGITVATGVQLAFESGAEAQTAASWGPKWTETGELVLPKNYHEWVFLGSPLTPNALNDGEAGFPEYHNVYVEREALAGYRKTGTWPEGTTFLKELQLTLPGENPDGSRLESSGRGFFPGARNGIDVSVKDSVRFKDTNGWGFFNFGHHAPPYAKTAKAAPADSCAGCHEANATDMVFSKFYAPILNAK